MGTVELAQKYGVSVMTIYNIVLELRTRKRMRFTKRGGKYNFTPQEQEIIEKELRRRGYTPRKED